MPTVTSMKKLLKWQYAPFLLLAVYALILALRADITFGDTSWYIQITETTSLQAFVALRYSSWTSRIFIEAALYGFMLHPWVWRLCFALTITATAVALSRLLHLSRNANLFTAGLFLCLPASLYQSAGWIATTANYQMPICCAVLAMLPISEALRGHTVKGWQYALSVPALLYAANLEQIALILLAFCVIFLGVAIAQHKPVCYLAIHSFLCALSLALILLCPGNSVRYLAETETWFLTFDTLSVFRKLEIGFSSTLFRYFFQPDTLFLLFTLLIGFAALSKHQSILKRCVAWIPTAILIVFGFGVSTRMAEGWLPSVYRILSPVTDALGTYGTFPTVEVLSSWIPDLVLLTGFCALLLSVYWLSEDRKTSILYCLILLSGFCSRMIVAFSPTVWASDTRTFAVMETSVILLAALLFERHAAADGLRHARFYRYAAILCIAFQTADTLLSVC